MRGYLTLDTARLRRLNSVDGKVEARGPGANSEHLEMLVSIETGRGLEGTPLEPYVSLARGKLDVAVRQANKIGEGRERVLRLVASSDGATRAMMEEALALPLDESDDFQTAIAMYAVAVEASARSGAVRRRSSKRCWETKESRCSRSWNTLRRGGDPAQARAALPAFDLRLRMHALHAAVIMLGRGAPGEWRAEASRGLFVGERGYMRSL